MEKGTILIIDDDPGIVRFLRMALEDEGYGVLCAVDGAALTLAHDQRPDVILLDLMMPQMDGIEVSRRLRADPVTAQIPIIVMSAHDRARALAAEMCANDELSKPFHFGDMYATVARWMPAA